MRPRRPGREADDVVMAVTHGGTAILAGRELFLGGQDDLIERIAGLVPANAVHAVITPNVDQTLNLRTDARLRTAFDQAEIRITDGFPLVKLGHLLGARRLERLTGADLLPLVAEQARDRGWRIVVTGGAQRVAEQAARNLREQYGADVLAVPFPKITSVDDDASKAVVHALVDAQPDLVFVCLGSPKQDIWVSHWREQLPGAVYIGAGAAVDFVAGTKKRAPRTLQRAGGEWVYRLSQEPRRLAYRYLVRGPLFLGVAVRSVAGSLAQRLRRRPDVRRSPR